MAVDFLSDSSCSLFALLAAGAAFKFGALFWLRQKKDERMVPVGKVTRINIFPVKSCKGITVNSARATSIGVHYDGVFDRSFLVIETNGMYITQRQEPTMALIMPSFHGEMVHFDAPGMETLKVLKNLPSDQNNLIKFQVKLDILDAVDCGPAASTWFSKYLKRPGIRLVFYAPDLPKRDLMTVVKAWDTKALPGDVTNFCDFCPYLLASEDSLDAVNGELTNAVTMCRFRANIVMKGSAAFEEESWTEFKIGEARFRGLDLCTRCVLTTVDPELGMKDPNQQPLKTMEKYHSNDYYKGKALFGLNAALDYPGDIKIGDTVYAFRG